jgi:hypothetical protein
MASPTQATAILNPSAKKRRFQPPITKFFAPAIDDQNGNLSFNNYSSPTCSPTPALSPDILNGLFSAGARVRKSVTEGYKTEQKKMTMYTVSHKPNLVSSQLPCASYAELEPFGGLQKVGNHAVQTFPRPPEDYRMETIGGDEDMFSIPSSSQESNASSVFSINPNKRSHDSDLDDMDGGGDDEWSGFQGSFTTGRIWQDPLRLNPVSNLPATMSASQRAILSPKFRQQGRRVSARGKYAKAFPEQENEDPTSLIRSNYMDVDDFGEASFLRAREEVDCDCTWNGREVEMSNS